MNEINKSIPSIKKIIIVQYDDTHKKYKTNFDYENWLSIISDYNELHEDELFNIEQDSFVLEKLKEL